jgi:hypothetical protein
VVADPEAARAVGRRGAAYVRSMYNPAAVARVVMARLEQIESLLTRQGRLAAGSVPAGGGGGGGGEL